MISENQKTPNDEWNRRVGNNQRNQSNEVFQFGSNLAYPNEKERFSRIDTADVEKNRQQKEREKRQDRYDFKRSWKSEIETSRWQNMSSDYNKEQEILKSKQSRARIGKNSVSYNPINLEYHHNRNGAALAQEDAKAMFRTSVRSLNLYLKNNSFDPMRCQDIRGTSEPQAPVQKEIAMAAETGQSTQPNPGVESLSRPKFGRRSHHPITTSGEKNALSVPKLLIDTAISNAELVKKRLGDKGGDFAPTLSTNILDGDNQRWARHY